MQTQPQHRISARAGALLFALGLLWGGSFFFARIAVQHVPPFTLVFLRLSIAALALHVFIAGRYGLYAVLARRWPAFLLLGLINNAIPHSLIFLGQTEIGAGFAAILNATTPIFTVLIAHLLTRDERLTPAKLVGCLTGLAGTAVMVGPSAVSLTAHPLWAVLLPIGAAISYGFATIWGKQFKGVAAPVIAAGQLTASSLLMLPVSLIVDRPWSLPIPPVTTMAAVLALALASTALGYILFFRIIALAGAVNASLVTLLVPPSAILLGTLFLGEVLSAADLAGLALILIGLVIIDGRLLRWSRRPAPG